MTIFDIIILWVFFGTSTLVGIIAFGLAHGAKVRSINRVYICLIVWFFSGIYVASVV